MAKKVNLSYEKINLFGPAVGLGPPAAMAKQNGGQCMAIQYDQTVCTISASKEGKSMLCTRSVFIAMKKICVRNFSPLG